MRHILLLLAIVSVINAQHIHKESWYQEIFCSNVNGTVEYTQPDATRVDCLMDNYAVEADFDTKWAESIGQALYYGYRTRKAPGVLLIIEDHDKGQKYLHRLRVVAEREGITVWTITPDKNITLRYAPVSLD